MSAPGGVEDIRRYRRGLHSVFFVYVAGLIAFLLLMALAERAGVPRVWIGGTFLFGALALFAAVGAYCRTGDEREYYVAGQRVPAVYNGMAAAADWMSAASFISLAGGLYLQGFGGTAEQPGGLAYMLGWTGGFCLLSLLVAPYLRRHALYTIPEYFMRRYGGVWPRRLAALAVVLCSFTYVIAQIYGVGLITSRLIGLRFEMSVLLGLSGVLMCSFLGGMRAVTWTQVAQYVIMLVAFLVPVSWLSYQQLGNPLAPLVFGQQIAHITALEDRVLADPAEALVIDNFRRQAALYESKLRDVEQVLLADREAAQRKLQHLRDNRAGSAAIYQAMRELTSLPRDVDAARAEWTQALRENLERAQPLGGLPRHAQAFAGDPEGTADERQAYELSRRNFIALMFCLMLGTAGLPHLVTRYYTTASVDETRRSVAWSLVFIALLYLSIPALAVLVKYEVLSNLVGRSFDHLPAWMGVWAKIDPNLLAANDVNGDGILQFGELRLGADLIMLATPELGGMPYVVTALVAAGGLAAAISTADGLLLTIGNAVSRDWYFRDLNPQASSQQIVILSKFALLIVALVAAYVALQRPGGILFLVAASFSLAASALVPAMVLGVFWRGMTRTGAVAAMLVGLGVTVTYLLLNAEALRAVTGLGARRELWWGIQPVSAGVFGVPAGLTAGVLVSFLQRAIASRRSVKPSAA